MILKEIHAVDIFLHKEFLNYMSIGCDSKFKNVVRITFVITFYIICV